MQKQPVELVWMRRPSSMEGVRTATWHRLAIAIGLIASTVGSPPFLPPSISLYFVLLLMSKSWLDYRVGQIDAHINACCRIPAVIT